ncbi:MAG: hypothetical protein ACK5N4_07915 [Parabacteroides gordonii]|jgi:hypothetical protein|nr:hypothetical protein [Parabacteroides gordonii]
METNFINLNLVELNNLELQETEGGSFFVIACCSLAFAAGLGTALMII